jgi:gp16 family phage-associated protein
MSHSTTATQLSFAIFAHERLFEPPESKLKTRHQVRAEFDRKGVSIASWAREHKVSRSLVYEILAGRKKCIRGNSHRVAVLLGLKDGEIVSGASAVNVSAGANL